MKRVQLSVRKTWGGALIQVANLKKLLHLSGLPLTIVDRDPILTVYASYKGSGIAREIFSEMTLDMFAIHLTSCQENP